MWSVSVVPYVPLYTDTLERCGASQLFSMRDCTLIPWRGLERSVVLVRHSTLILWRGVEHSVVLVRQLYADTLERCGASQLFPMCYCTLIPWRGVERSVVLVRHSTLILWRGVERLSDLLVLDREYLMPPSMTSPSRAGCLASERSGTYLAMLRMVERTIRCAKHDVVYPACCSLS